MSRLGKELEQHAFQLSEPNVHLTCFQITPDNSQKNKSLHKACSETKTHRLWHVLGSYQPFRNCWVPRALNTQRCPKSFSSHSETLSNSCTWPAGCALGSCNLHLWILDRLSHFGWWTGILTSSEAVRIFWPQRRKGGRGKTEYQKALHK